MAFSFSSIRRLFYWSIFLFVLFGKTVPAHALDIWAVTSQGRILVIRHVESHPVQEFIVTHDPVSDSFYGDFGDIGFAPNGNLYGISAPLWTHALLYTIALDTGHITPVAGSFPFIWGNALAFDPLTGRGYAGGGLQSYSPYVFLQNLYAFDAYDPATTIVWHDMGDMFPPSGFTGGDYVVTNGHVYVVWAVREGSGANYTDHYYLVEAVPDQAGNFASATNLGEFPLSLDPNGLWGLATDGQTIYASSPSTLYRVDIANGTATYTPIFTYQLNPGETVNGTTSRWADLSITQQLSTTDISQNQPVGMDITVHNAGPYPAPEVQASIEIPPGLELTQSTPDAGVYNLQNGTWQITNLAVGQTVVLHLILMPVQSGTFESRAQITASSEADPDSNPLTGYDTDDLHDSNPDDDESSVTFSVTPARAPLPATGFPPRQSWKVAPAPESRPSDAPTAMVLKIPALHVEAPIVGVPVTASGWDVAWLGHEVGWLVGSAFPTWKGNTVLVGHVWDADNTPGVFAHLKRLRFGDQVFVQAEGRTYVYAVRENRRLSADAFSQVFRHETRDWLTLLTCEGYDAPTQTYRYRRMVRAILVAVWPER